MFYIGLVLIFALVAQKETIGDISEHILQSLSRVNPHRYTIIYPKNNISLQLKNIFPIVQCRSRKYKDIFTNPVIEYQNDAVVEYVWFSVYGGRFRWIWCRYDGGSDASLACLWHLYTAYA